MNKIVIYQTLPRIYGAKSKTNKPNGDIKQNGCGKMQDYTAKALEQIKGLGCNYIWYTGLIEHAQKTDYSEFGIQHDNPTVVKGNAGSPYAIKDYYDIDPDLAHRVPARMKEFEQLVKRTHDAGLKMIIDFVPNHVARQYHSDSHPADTRDLGADDDTTVAFSPQNNFYYLPGQALSTVNIAEARTGTGTEAGTVTKAEAVTVTKAEAGTEAGVGAEAGAGVNSEEPYVENPAKVTGNDCFTACPGRNDWYETVKLNYGIDYMNGRSEHFGPDVPSTWHKMLHILQFWASKGIDGFRCDMAEMVPCQFWGWAIPQVKASHKDIIFIAEVYNPQEYRNYIFNGKFDYLYDKVGLYDTLRAVIAGDSASKITQCWQSVDDINGHMLNFLENHDEQRLASDFFAGQAEKGRPALLVSALMHTNPFMVYNGQELGERGMDEEGFSGLDGRTTIFDYWTVDKIRRFRNGGKYDGKLMTGEEAELYAYYQKVLNLCNGEKAVREGCFFDLMYANYDNPLMDTNRLYAFIRKAGKEDLLVVANFGDADTTASVVIPQHALDCLGIQPSTYTTTDLLTGKRQHMAIAAEQPITLTLKAHDGVVLKFRG